MQSLHVAAPPVPGRGGRASQQGGRRGAAALEGRALPDQPARGRGAHVRTPHARAPRAQPAGGAGVVAEDAKPRLAPCGHAVGIATALRGLQEHIAPHAQNSSEARRRRRGAAACSAEEVAAASRMVAEEAMARVMNDVEVQLVREAAEMQAIFARERKERKKERKRSRAALPEDVGGVMPGGLSYVRPDFVDGVAPRSPHHLQPATPRHTAPHINSSPTLHTSKKPHCSSTPSTTAPHGHQQHPTVTNNTTPHDHRVAPRPATPLHHQHDSCAHSTHRLHPRVLAGTPLLLRRRLRPAVHARPRRVRPGHVVPLARGRPAVRDESHPGEDSCAREAGGHTACGEARARRDGRGATPAAHLRALLLPLGKPSPLRHALLQGGSLERLLTERSFLPEDTVRFFVAQLVLALGPPRLLSLPCAPATPAQLLPLHSLCPLPHNPAFATSFL